VLINALKILTQYVNALKINASTALVFSDFFAIFGCRGENCDEMDEIDQENLRTGTAIGSRASHEH